MATIEKQACDQCFTETEDYYECIGWTRIKATQLHVSNGRRKGGQAKAGIFKDWNCNNEFDFCSTKCFMDFFKAILSEKKKQ